MVVTIDDVREIIRHCNEFERLFLKLVQGTRKALDDSDVPLTQAERDQLRTLMLDAFNNLKTKVNTVSP